MTAYRTSTTTYSPLAAAARAAKARRQAVLRRVRTQRAAVHKRTIADWMKEGLVMTGIQLKAKLANITRAPKPRR
jgi:hypothetical protein